MRKNNNQTNGLGDQYKYLIMSEILIVINLQLMQMNDAGALKNCQSRLFAGHQALPDGFIQRYSRRYRNIERGDRSSHGYLCQVIDNPDKFV